MPSSLLHKAGLGLGLAMLLGASQCVVAPPPGAGGGYGVPNGSYLNTCRDEYVTRGGTLVAECRTDRGRWVEASLPLPCYGDVANRDGNLVCRGDRGPDYAVPNGPYLDDCVEPRVSRYNVLLAECQTRRGQWVNASLQLPCDGRVVFRRGELRCRG